MYLLKTILIISPLQLPTFRFQICNQISMLADICNISLLPLKNWIVYFFNTISRAWLPCIFRVVLQLDNFTSWYHLKVWQFLLRSLQCDINLRCICCCWLSLTDETSPLHPSSYTHNAFVKFLSLMCVWWIFFRCFLQAISDQNKCTCTFLFFSLLATATPPGRVKIDSLASSTRQLRAICSHLGCSSSFCFCDCSSNIIGLKVLARMGVGGGSRGGGAQKWGVAWGGINRI